MFRPEFDLPPAAFVDTARIAPAAGRAPGGFPALMREVRSEVADFIEHGSPAMGLNASGQVLRLRARMAAEAAPAVSAPASEAGEPTTQAATTSVPPLPVGTRQQAFLDAIAPFVAEAGARLGVSPQVLAAQAALESGWGQRPLRDGDGADTHNLFGLKAGAGWRGAVAEALTTEYEEGAAVQRSERFRSYPDSASAFRDFTRLLLDSPRYQAALNTGADAVAYAQALQRGGYASDPAYAEKLARIAARLQRGG